jgi:hypothetical protein
MSRLIPAVVLLFMTGKVLAQDADTVYEETVTEYSDEAAVQAPRPTDPESLGTTEAYKNEKIEVQKFDKAEWRKIVAGTDYREEKYKAEEENEEKNDEKRSSQTISAPWSGPVLTVVFYVIIIAIVLLILWAIVKNISVDLKLKKAANAISDPEGSVENIEEIDIDSFLKKARREKNYRLAIRLYYLGLLKRLNETGAIIWKKDKTNLEYLTELFTRDYHYHDIRRLTLAYEEVWYGERMLTDETFSLVSDSFESIFNKLNSSNAR